MAKVVEPLRVEGARRAGGRLVGAPGITAQAAGCESCQTGSLDWAPPNRRPASLAASRRCQPIANVFIGRPPPLGTGVIGGGRGPVVARPPIWQPSGATSR